MKTTDQIITAVATTFEVSEADIKSDSRVVEVCFARQVCITFVWLLGGSCRYAGASVNRDHATASHSIKVVENLYNLYENVKPTIDTLCLQLIGENPGDLGSLIASRRNAPTIAHFIKPTAGRSSAQPSWRPTRSAFGAQKKVKRLPLR